MHALFARSKMPLTALLFAAALAVSSQTANQNTSTLDPEGTVHITRTVPVSAAISDEAKKYMARPVHPGAASVEDNRKAADAWQAQMARDGQELYPAKITESEIGGVSVRIFEAADIPADHRDRVLINLHGGGFEADWGSVVEALPLAASGRYCFIYSNLNSFRCPVAIRCLFEGTGRV